MIADMLPGLADIINQASRPQSHCVLEGMQQVKQCCYHCRNTHCNTYFVAGVMQLFLIKELALKLFATTTIR